MKINYAKIFKDLVESDGYELLSKYVGNRTKVEIKCDKGHVYEVRPNNFKNGQRCPKCGDKCSKQAKEQLIELIQQEDYELLSEYKNSKTKVKLRCTEGHVYSVTPNAFKNGDRCPKCSNNCPIQSRKQFIELLQQEGYELLSEYKGTMKNVELKCPKGHVWNVRPNTFKRGVRCGVCDISRISKPEIEVGNFVVSLNINFIKNDRTTILNQETGRYLELDLWFPELNKAIEFNGRYWHGLDETIKRDQYKKEYCEWKDIDLLIIEEQDWYDSKKCIMTDIKDFLTSKLDYLKKKRKKKIDKEDRDEN